MLSELPIQIVAPTGSTVDLMQLVAMHRPDAVKLNTRMPPCNPAPGGDKATTANLKTVRGRPLAIAAARRRWS